MIYIVYSEILLSHKKEWNLAICNNMDRPRWHYANEISQREKDKLSYDFIYMWNLQNKQNKTETDS